MKLDLLLSGDLDAVHSAARAADDLGLDGCFVGENHHDPFLQLVPVALARPLRLDVGTSVAVAFARNPMTVATLAHDLQQYSGGRFVLGLGSQVRAHVTYRFSMPWSNPAVRMREFVSAVRAIWRTWNEGAPLHFQGDYYTHTLMTPMFDPGPSPHGPPPIFLAAVGPKMTEAAGAVADGLFVHAFHSEDHLRSETLPALRHGCAQAGRTEDAVTISVPVFVVTGRDEAELARASSAVRERIAFYASTPAYRPVLEHHGWGDAQTELHDLAERGEWSTMGDVLDDSMLRTFAVVGEPAAVWPEIVRRYGDVAGRVSCSMPYDIDRSLLRLVAEGLRGLR